MQSGVICIFFKCGDSKRLKLFFVPPIEIPLEALLIYQLFNYLILLSVSCREYLWKSSKQEHLQEYLKVFIKKQMSSF